MGWDGYANDRKEHLDEFRDASSRVLEKADSVDCLLADGALDCSDCAYMLEEATHRSAWDDNGWTAEEVKELAKNAYWEDLENISRDDWWAALSAREFLETCAAIGTGIHFSY